MRFMISLQQHLSKWDSYTNYMYTIYYFLLVWGYHTIGMENQMLKSARASFMNSSSQALSEFSTIYLFWVDDSKYLLQLHNMKANTDKGTILLMKDPLLRGKVSNELGHWNQTPGSNLGFHTFLLLDLNWGNDFSLWCLKFFFVNYE